MFLRRVPQEDAIFSINGTLIDYELSIKRIDYENDKTFPYMGSYGIGISRIPAAIIEAFNDDNGIIWPKEVSPFDIVLINLISNNESTVSFCENLYSKLKEKNYDEN